MKFGTIIEAEAFLERYIAKNKGQQFPGNLGLERTKFLLKQLKNPQNKLKIIHIAGTSGKTSTAFYTSLILRSLGFKTGLHVSPYLLDFRERFQINNRLIPKNIFCKYLNDLLPAIKKTSESKFSDPSYFEILTALAFYIFWKEKVDYAVVETGLGGLLDATNTVSTKNKLNLLTKIGHDHTKILGQTLEKIARQKAGIIQPATKTISIWQIKSVRDIFAREAKRKASLLYYVRKNINFKNIKLKNNRIVFDFSFEGNILENIELQTNAFFQAENSALALAAVSFLGQRDKFPFDATRIKKALKNNFLPGRMDTCRIKGKTIILDGAHNPQKMKAFFESLQQIYPRQKFSFLVAIKRGKDYGPMLRAIASKAEDIILSTFEITGQDMLHTSEKSEKLARHLQKIKFSRYEIVPDTKLALKKLLEKYSPVLIVTGSIYLLGKIYPLLRAV